MPPECKEFVDNIHLNMDVTVKLMFNPIFRKARNWKELLRTSSAMLSYAKNQVQLKIEEIERSTGVEDVEQETDFLTYMIHTGKMSIQEIATNAIDLMIAGVDTVSYSRNFCLGGKLGFATEVLGNLANFCPE